MKGKARVLESRHLLAAYVVVETDGAWEGPGLAFTIGRGNEIFVAVIRALAPLIVGRSLMSMVEDMSGFLA